MAFLISIREQHGIPPLKRYFIMFVWGHTVLFLCLCDLVSKGCHKATTHNYVPQEGGIICKLALCLVCFESIEFTLVEHSLLRIIFKIILLILEMDIPVSDIIE